MDENNSNFRELTETITDDLQRTAAQASVSSQLDQQYNNTGESLTDDPSRNDLGVSVHAGFPNAAADRQGRLLDFNSLLIRSSVSTFVFRVRGNTHEARGIFDGDIAVIDRAMTPVLGDLMICWDEDGFVLSTYRGRASRDDGELIVFGVVTSIIHQYRRPQPAGRQARVERL